MPSINPIRTQDSVAYKERIQELKGRAAEALDSAMDVVAQNLGHTEAEKAHQSLDGLNTELASAEAPAHRLDIQRVMDLIADPFEDD